jgi:hypothetical protein
MAVAQFEECLEKGKEAEQWSINYFKKNNIIYSDVREDPEYQEIDIDFITDTLGKVEVKNNYYDALYGKQGWFFRIELDNDKRHGWWGKTKANYFIFYCEKKAILIKNNNTFKNFVNNAIENGNHSNSGNNRFDITPDNYYGKTIYSKTMRIYITDLENTGICYFHIANRRKI